MYNNPNFYPYPNFPMKQPIFSKLRNLNFTEILNGTQKTLSVINQAIPIFYQLKPLINNTKTIFKIASAINNDQKEEKTNKQDENKPKSEINTRNNIDYNKPTFFI